MYSVSINIHIYKHIKIYLLGNHMHIIYTHIHVYISMYYKQVFSSKRERNLINKISHKILTMYLKRQTQTKTAVPKGNALHVSGNK